MRGEWRNSLLYCVQHRCEMVARLRQFPLISWPSFVQERYKSCLQFFEAKTAPMPHLEDSFLSVA